MNKDPPTDDIEVMWVVPDIIFTFIQVGPSKLDDDQAMVNVKEAFLSLKVPIVGIVALDEMSAIGCLKMVLDDWYIKRNLTNSTFTSCLVT